MKIEFSITLPAEVSTLILKALSKYDDVANDEPVNTVAEAPAKPATKATAPAKTSAAPKAGASKKPGKAKAAEPEVIEELEPQESAEPEEPVDEQGDDDDFAEPSEDEDELISFDEQKTLKAALRAHSEKHKSREGAAKILMKYAKTSDQVKKKDLPALMKALKV